MEEPTKRSLPEMLGTYNKEQLLAFREGFYRGVMVARHNDAIEYNKILRHIDDQLKENADDPNANA